MTILSSESTVTGAGTVVLPRVNLLPPEIAAQRAFRRVQVGLGVAVLAAFGVAGMMYASAAHGVSSAQSELDAATAQRTSLQTETGKYAGVQAVYASAAAAKLQLVQAMSDEVRFSQLLNDFSLTIPGNVWIMDMSLSKSSAPATAAGAASVTRTATAAAGPVSVAELSFKGVAFSHDDVATWLESLTRIKGLNNAYFDKSSEALIGERTVVNYDSTVTVTSDLLSGRYTKAD